MPRLARDERAEKRDVSGLPREVLAFRHCGRRVPVPMAEQGARANASVRHAACYRMDFEMKPSNENRSEARVVPATVVAHL